MFAVRESSGSPLWSLTVVESEAISTGTAYLIDPGRLGVLLTGAGSIVADPLTGLHQNVVRLRCEVEARAHVRSAVGAYTFTLQERVDVTEREVLLVDEHGRPVAVLVLEDGRARGMTASDNTYRAPQGYLAVLQDMRRRNANELAT